MSIHHLLSLADHLITEAEAPGVASGIRVVPVVVEDFASNKRPVIEAMRHIGVPTVEVTQHVDGAPGDLKKGIAKVVERQLLTGTGPTAGAKLEEDSGAVVLKLSGGAPPTDAGLREISGLSAALFHESIHESECAAIAYAEAPLDSALRDRAWSLFAEVLPSQRLGKLRTLFVLVDARLDVSRHCSGEVSCRFAYRAGEGFIERRPAESNLVDIRRLARERRLVLFLGAGSSLSSGIDLANTVRDEALVPFGDAGLEPEELAERFWAYVSGNHELLPDEEGVHRDELVKGLTLERVLREELKQYRPEHSPTLARMSSQNDSALTTNGGSVTAVRRLTEKAANRLVLITVNFDTLIEHDNANVECFDDDAGFDKCAAYMEDYWEGRRTEVPLLKLHGSITAPDSIVATVDRAALGLSGPKSEAIEYLAGSNERVAFVYVGYSMRDPDVMKLLALPLFGQKFDESWAHPHRAPGAVEFIREHRTEVWKGLDQRYKLTERSITETADDFLTRLDSEWAS